MLEVLTKFKEVWASITGFVTIRDEFNAAVGSIQKTSRASGIKTGEVTKGKNEAFTKFVELLFKVTSLLSVHATSTNNTDLKNAVDYTEGELKDMRPGELLGISKDILGLIKKHKTALTPLGLKESDETAIHDFVENFESVTSLTRSAITARKTAGVLLNPQFKNASFILKEKLDNLMEQFRESDPGFYQEYWNARNTIDYGTRHEKADKKAE